MGGVVDPGRVSGVGAPENTGILVRDDQRRRRGRREYPFLLLLASFLTEGRQASGRPCFFSGASNSPESSTPLFFCIAGACAGSAA